MRLRTLTASLAVAAAATIPLAGVALAQPDRNCDDFSSQQEAQDALLPNDPDGLDEDDDGQACENFDYGSSSTPPADDDESADDESAEEEGTDDEDGSDDEGQVAVVPQGGVDTGDGSSAPGSAAFVVAGAVAAAVAAGTARRRRTSR